MANREPRFPTFLDATWKFRNVFRRHPKNPLRGHVGRCNIMTRIAYNTHTNPEAASISLGRLLSRLEQRLLLPENTTELSQNPYLRNKLGVVSDRFCVEMKLAD